MCAILGSIGTPLAPGLPEAMLLTMGHRGPDGAGLQRHAVAPGCEVMLGHRRLSIIDLTTAGSQPMADSSGAFTITYNGEIYNYLEVQAELRRLGVSFASASDTEVLLEAYKQWGADCLKRLNGMFAFAIHDHRRGVVFCARDRYGEKPLLYAKVRGRITFASEYKALLRDPSVPLDYDEWRLLQAAYNASTGLDADAQTVFHAIHQLLPGEAIEIDVRTLAVKTWRYWSITPGELRRFDDEREAFAEFRDLLRDSVRLRLRSDVSVGSCLSGGLDSGAIVMLVRELLGPDATYHAFTGRFPGTAADEWRYAEPVVKRSNVVSHVVEPTVDSFLDELPDFMWLNELPVGSSSQYAQWCVFRLARQNSVTVLLDGQGADELLGGYEQYFAFYVEALKAAGANDRLAAELPAIRERYPLALTPPSRAVRDRLPFGLRHWVSAAFGIGTNLLYGLKPEVAGRVAQEPAFDKLAGFDPLANALVQDSFGRYLTTLLRYGDRNSMAHSREVRLPFCDHRLAEFVFTMPPQVLMGDVQTKRLLRESMRGLLPEEVRTRWNKQGFRPPQELWFESPRMLDAVRDAFASPSFRKGPYWIPQWWDKALARARAGEAGLAWVLWRPFILEKWKTEFLDRVEASRREPSLPRTVELASATAR
ncbi:MAG TPA: asparagine synthase (glutamine-hydrolyzing) [Usitatibacter sp.]